MDFHPDGWDDVVTYLIVGIPAIIAAVGVIFNARNAKESHKTQMETADAVLEEVKNDHKINLRDDIDALGASIRQGFKEIHIDISGLREELRTERIERIEGDRRGINRLREVGEL